MGRITQTAAWMSVLPLTTNCMDLGVQEWRCYLFLHYSIEPPDLPEHCYGCGAEFDICHALDCEKKFLISARHNDLHYGVPNLASNSFTPTHVHDDPKI